MFNEHCIYSLYEKVYWKCFISKLKNCKRTWNQTFATYTTNKGLVWRHLSKVNKKKITPKRKMGKEYEQEKSQMRIFEWLINVWKDKQELKIKIALSSIRLATKKVLTANVGRIWRNCECKLGSHFAKHAGNTWCRGNVRVL